MTVGWRCRAVLLPCWVIVFTGYEMASRCVHDHRFEGDLRCRAIVNRGVMGDFQLPDHLHGPVGGLRDRCCEPCEDGSGCVFRIERVGLAVESAQAPVWSGDLDDLVTVTSQERGETSPVGAGAFDSERDDLPKPCSPIEKLFEARSIGRDGEGCEDSPD